MTGRALDKALDEGEKEGGDEAEVWVEVGRGSKRLGIEHVTVLRNWGRNCELGPRMGQHWQAKAVVRVIWASASWRRKPRQSFPKIPFQMADHDERFEARSATRLIEQSQNCIAAAQLQPRVDGRGHRVMRVRGLLLLHFEQDLVTPFEL
jgi:hypothetical protein